MASKDAPRFSYFQEIRKQNPHKYFTQHMQAQMVRAYEEQGFLFFDIGGLRH